MNTFVENIEKITQTNKNFRKVLFTGQHVQLVVMSLDPQEDIGKEVHTTTDQFIRIEKGNGKVILNGKEQEISDGFALVIPAGTTHNVINTSKENPLKLYTVYSPPHHKEATIHKTKKEAENDHSDHL